MTVRPLFPLLAQPLRVLTLTLRKPPCPPPPQLYYSLCFLLLAAEVVLSTVILGPWPHVLRRKIFTFLNENPVVRPCPSLLLSSFGWRGLGGA